MRAAEAWLRRLSSPLSLQWTVNKDLPAKGGHTGVTLGGRAPGLAGHRDRDRDVLPGFRPAGLPAVQGVTGSCGPVRTP
jgi:hypothetical protein